MDNTLTKTERLDMVKKLIASGLSQAEIARGLRASSTQIVNNWVMGKSYPHVSYTGKLLELHSKYIVKINPEDSWDKKTPDEKVSIGESLGVMFPKDKHSILIAENERLTEELRECKIMLADYIIKEKRSG